MIMAKHQADSRKSADRIPVWIADDNKSFCFLLSEALNQSKQVVCHHYYHSGKAVLEALTKEDVPPSVLLLDIKMPRMTGLDVIASAKELSPLTRIIMLTSYDSDENIRIALNHGASGYLLKTSTPPEIVSAVIKAQRGGAALDGTITKRMLQAFLGQSTQNPYHLTQREKEVLQCAASGMTVKELALKLNLSFYTVETHLKNIYQKFRVHNRQGLLTKATKERLV